LVDQLGAGSDNLRHPIKRLGEFGRKLVLGRVTIPGSELLAEIGLDAAIQDSSDR
jgi:hypothetical protein